MSHDLTKGSPLKNILMMSFPMMFGYLFQQFYSLVDFAAIGLIIRLIYWWSKINKTVVDY